MTGAGKTFRRQLKARATRLGLRALGQARPAPAGATLVIAPHPDDEVLACGGLIALSRKAGGRVGIVYLTSGENSHVDCCGIEPAQVGLRREQLAIAAAGELGVAQHDLHFLRLPDGGIPAPAGPHDAAADGGGLAGAPGIEASPRAPRFAQAAGRLAEIITAFGAEHVLCPHAMDCRKDHQNAAKVTLAAIELSGLNVAAHSYLLWGFFKLPLRAIRGLLRARPWSLDISGALAAKKAAMSRYFDSCAPCGLPYVGRLPAGFADFFANRREYFFDEFLADYDLRS